MQVSVIISVFNEEESILDCLSSLKKQSLRNFQTIVVDDGSKDKSQEIIRGFQKENPRFSVKLLAQNHKGPGIARNLGAGKAIGEILVFLDADMTFERNFIFNLVKPIIEGKTKGTFSKEEYVSNWDNVWARCWNINENWEKGKRHSKNYPDRQKVFRAILKKEFNRVGGFTPGGYDDDWSLGIKLGYDAVASLGAKFYHKNPDSLKEVFLHAKWVGKRKYKFGYLGKLFALLRASLPVSLIAGFYKFILSGVSSFVVFKVVYDFGLFLGIVSSFFNANLAK